MNLTIAYRRSPQIKFLLGISYVNLKCHASKGRSCNHIFIARVFNCEWKAWRVHTVDLRCNACHHKNLIGLNTIVIESIICTLHWKVWIRIPIRISDQALIHYWPVRIHQVLGDLASINWTWERLCIDNQCWLRNVISVWTLISGTWERDRISLRTIGINIKIEILSDIFIIVQNYCQAYRMSSNLGCLINQVHECIICAIVCNEAWSF